MNNFFGFLTPGMSVKEIWVLHILSVPVLICAVSVFDWKNVALSGYSPYFVHITANCFLLGLEVT